LKPDFFKKFVFACTAVSASATAVFALLYRSFKAELFEIAAICFITCFYHFAMRLAVGYTIDGIFHNRMNYRRKWFQPLPFEAALYRKLKVKAWKDRIPTFTPEGFSLEAHSLEEIAGAMCQAEIVHELNMLLSFVPLLFTFLWGSFPVFLITSLLSAAADSVFVILQRSNRPRVLRLLKRYG